MLKVVLFTLLVAVFSQKINKSLFKAFDEQKKADFVVHLERVNYKQMNYKGKSYESLDIDTKAQFIFETLSSHAERSQMDITCFLKEKKVQFSSLWIINSVIIKDGSYELAAELSKRSDVKEIVYDEKYTVAPFSTTEAVAQEQQKIEWNLQFTNVPALWAKGFTGKGKLVAIVDTGCNYRHPSLFHTYNGNKNGTVNHDYSWFDPNGRMQEPADTQDHGSHCTGTILGATVDKKYITGASYDSKHIHCHFGGSFAAIAKCFQFLLAPTDRAGKNPNPALRPHVSSHSYGGGGAERSQLEQVVLPVLDAGVHCVIAAHNYGSRCGSVTDPGIIPRVLTVGALGDKTHVIAPFSSRGPNNAHYNRGIKPDISSPGVNIVSANGRTGSTDYTSKSGTSMATPLVAGIISLLWEAVPALNRQIEKTNKILYETSFKQTSNDCSSQGTPNNVYGHGTINALKAYEKAIELYGDK